MYYHTLDLNQIKGEVSIKIELFLLVLLEFELMVLFEAVDVVCDVWWRFYC